jgi:uncharacterized membrane protein
MKMKLPFIFSTCMAACLFMAAACNTATKKQSEAGRQAAEPIISYNCSGNEPFWNVRIDSSAILFHHMDMGKTFYPYRSPLKQGAVLTFESASGDSKITVKLEEKTCFDSMSGFEAPYTVTVVRDGETFTGCGDSSLNRRKGGER